MVASMITCKMNFAVRGDTENRIICNGERTPAMRDKGEYIYFPFFYILYVIAITENRIHGQPK